MFGLELQRRLRGAGVPLQSLVAQPGFSHTGLQARSVQETEGGRSQRFWHVLVGIVGSSPAAGARPLLRAATDPRARGGELYGPLWGASGPPVRRPLLDWPGRREAARALWRLSERETGEPFDVRRILANG